MYLLKKTNPPPTNNTQQKDDPFDFAALKSTTPTPKNDSGIAPLQPPPKVIVKPTPTDDKGTLKKKR